ncbi:MAG: hypothetical protein KAR35_08915 [Candidatus Heimdallarchaeota archaeon]|nr:hypothetical protein [Candidatus Heimdallarchaeota archaeon]MCK5049477.1 hypothetical protein [Candidatus Heimdallarchaeota archaeon]
MVFWLSVLITLHFLLLHISNQTNKIEVIKISNDLYWRAREEDYIIPELDWSFISQHLVEQQFIKKIIYSIGSGKEASVYLAINSNDETIALKVYRIYHTCHRNKLLSSTSSRSSIKSAMAVQFASSLALTEFDQMVYLHEKGVPCPYPSDQQDYAFIMEYYGNDTGPSPLLKDVNLKEIGYDPISILEQLLDIYYFMFNKCQLVHGDFSEHNIIWHDDQLKIIDFLQSRKYNVSSHSPYASHGERIDKVRAFKMLEKDISSTLTHFLKKYGASFDYEEVMINMLDLDQSDLWEQTYETKVT